MAELTQKVSDVLLGQVGASDAGYSFEEVTVTYSTGMEIGAALELDTGKYIWVVALNVANTSAVLIDVRATAGYETLVNGTDYTFVVARRGVTVNKNMLTLADSVVAADITAAAVAFEAAGANKVTAYVES